MWSTAERRLVHLISYLLILLVTETLARSIMDGRRRASTLTSVTPTVDEMDAEVVAVFERFNDETGRFIEEIELVNPGDDDIEITPITSAVTDDDVEQDGGAAAVQPRDPSTRVRSAPLIQRSGRGGSRTRARRHVDLSEVERTSRFEHDGSGIRTRQRRSAIGWIQAAVRLCDTGRSSDRRCRRVEVNDGRFHMSIRLEER